MIYILKHVNLVLRAARRPLLPWQLCSRAFPTLATSLSSLLLLRNLSKIRWLSTTVCSQCIRNVQGVVSMAGSLSGAVGEDSPPSILIVAHYDSAGAAPRSLMITSIVALLCELNDNG